MTTDSGNTTVQPDTTNPNPQTTEGEAEETIIDNDPMILAMKEAEAEIAKGTEGEPAQTTEEGQTGEPAQTGAATTDQQPAGDGKAPMIPKARLDEVLSERDRYKDRAIYLEGVVNTQKSMVKPGEPTTQTQTTAAPAVDDYKTKIAKAEDDVVALAKKYEDGEISLVEFETGKLDLNRQIRALDEQRTVSLVEGVKTTATQVVRANNAQMAVENEAVAIQTQHPYVAEIDKLPKAIATGIWDEIHTEAMKNLAAKGVNPTDGTLASRIALVKEKAALTDIYGPKYTGIQGLKSGGQPGQQQPKTTAQQRADKLNLSEQQPPVTSHMGVTSETRELTAADIEGMSDDQLADALQRNPLLIEKAAGLRTR